MRITQILKKAFYLEQWNIGTAPLPPGSILDNPSLEITWWPRPARSVFQADPFFFGDKVLYERLNRWRGRGEIWIADPDGSNAYRFIRTSGHLSYPSTTIINGREYLAYEASDTGSCTIFGLESGKRREVATLEAPIVDPTLLYYENRCWLFGTLIHDDPNGKLHIWWADSIEGPWHPHHGNPVKIDKGSSRPAGNFFRSSAGLVRPAQDSRIGYGDAVVLNVVEKLTVDQYIEKERTRVSPTNRCSALGIHTLNIQSNSILVDGKRLVFAPNAWLFKFRNRLFGLKSG